MKYRVNNFEEFKIILKTKLNSIISGKDEIEFNENIANKLSEETQLFLVKYNSSEWSKLNQFSKYPKVLDYILSQYQHYGVPYGWSVNPYLNEEIQLKIINHENEIVRLNLARNPIALPNILHTLSFDENIAVREGVASNPNSNKETLKRLIKTTRNDYGVNKIIDNVANNPNSDAEILTELLYLSRTSYTYINIIKNKNCNSEILLKISETEMIKHKEIAILMAKNNKTPDQALKNIKKEWTWKDDNDEIIDLLKANKNYISFWKKLFG